MARRKHKDEMLDLSNRIFPYSHNLLEAFPRLSGGTIEYSQTGPRGMFSYPSRAHHEYLHESTLTSEFPVIRCDQSPVCRRGGFELWNRIMLMVADSKTDGEYELKCAGFTGSLRPNTAEPCQNTLRCHIALEYKRQNDEHLASDDTT
jgi:hypothetical protein